ncbi:MAG: serine--tRNA ligase [Candidatus Magasanikbacteria bacterium]|nr:serine--tRNA ligase [Candidatus Magasanikbacteria bacterium]
MIDIKYIRENKEQVKANCVNRRMNVDIDALLSIDDKRKSLEQELNGLRAERKAKSKVKPTPEIISEMKIVGEKIKELESSYETIYADFQNLMLQVPNLTHPKSPIGGEEDYVVVYKNQEPKSFTFSPKDHETLMLENDLIDFERATKVSGAKFYYTKGKMVRLNQALLAYGMDIIEKHGFKLMETPDVAKHEILKGAGFNPRGVEKQIYNIEDSDISLIGTAEITVLGYHADEILDLSNGPKKYAAVSHCFRTEAGAYGRTSKGLYRVHQFTKLELFVFCKPEDSEILHNELLEIEKEICDGLGFPYRVIDIPTGDLGGPAYRKYDVEAWMTMKGDEEKQGDYGEVTSTSNCTDYQARRLNIKYRKPDNETDFAHTLNGTAVVLSRFPIAIIENNQQADGSILIPEVLRPYMNNQKTLN